MAVVCHINFASPLMYSQVSLRLQMLATSTSHSSTILIVLHFAAGQGNFLYARYPDWVPTWSLYSNI